MGKPAARDGCDDLEVAVRISRTSPERTLDQRWRAACSRGKLAHGVPLEILRSVKVDEAISESGDGFQVARGIVGTLNEGHVICEAGAEVERS